ncbi:MAG: Ig-like domain-containing protein, partial [bacterium]
MKKFIKNKMFKKTLLALSLSILIVGGVFVYNTPAKAAANINIDSAAITSSNTVLVTFDSPGDRLLQQSYTRWHIDRNTLGDTPLNPVSATITSYESPWTITLTFPAASFAAGASYDDSHGLYVDANGVTDEAFDTNTVLAHGASIAIDDITAPTISSMTVIDSTHIAVVFTEAMNFKTNANNTPTAGELSNVTVGAIPATGVAFSDVDKTITFTFGSSIGTVTRADFAIAANTLQDEAATPNAFAAVLTQTLADGAGPEIVSASTTDGTTITATLSESIDRTQLLTTDFTVADDGSNDLGDTTISAVQNTGSGSTVTITITGPIKAGLAGTDTVAFSGAGVVTDGGTSNTQTAAITMSDGIAPTFISAITTSDTNIQLTFSEPISILQATYFKINGNPGIGTGASVHDDDNTKVDVTVTSLDNTAFTSSDLDILAGALKDLSPNNNPIVADYDNIITDGQKPTAVSAKITGPNTITVVYSESVTSVGGDYTAPGGDLAGRIFTVSGGSPGTTHTLTISGAALGVNAVGTMTIGAGVTDIATPGNTLTALPDYSVTDGQVPPAPTITTIAQSINAATINIVGTAQIGSTVNIYKGGVSVGNSVADGSGDFTVTATLAQNEVNSLTAKATDVAGEGTASSAVLITEDSIDPSIPTGLDLDVADDSGIS